MSVRTASKSTAAKIGAAFALALCASAFDAPPAFAQKSEGPVTEVAVTGGQRALLRLAVVTPTGDALGGQVAQTERRDFTFSSLFQVLDEKSFVANAAKEGAGIDVASWRTVGADGVIKGTVANKAGAIHLELSLFVVSRGTEAVLKRAYDVPQAGLRGAVHQFDNEVVKYFTGSAGSFGTRLVFSATVGKGEKGIFSIDSDGEGLGRLQAVSNVATAPATGPGGVYYSAGLPDGTYQLFRVGSREPVVRNPGLVFGVAFGGQKMALVISQRGESDVYVGAADGAGLKKATTGGINTHPAFGPSGQMAYVSNAGGSPQIYVEGKRVSWKGTYNMAPVFCNDPDGARILYMGREGTNWDIFSVAANGDASSTRRLTQDQGSNTYPSCSPDGRQVAFFSSRGGIYLANPLGQNQQKIADVQGESLRWEGN